MRERDTSVSLISRARPILFKFDVPKNYSSACEQAQTRNFHFDVFLSGLHLNDHTKGLIHSLVRTVYSIINCTTGKYCSIALI